MYLFIELCLNHYRIPPGSDGWVPLVSNEDIVYNINVYPFRFKTNIDGGSGLKVKIRFLEDTSTDTISIAGAFVMSFTSSLLKVALSQCTAGFVTITDPEVTEMLSSQGEDEWTLLRNEEGIELLLQNKPILTYLFESSPINPSCKDLWSAKVKKIQNCETSELFSPMLSYKTASPGNLEYLYSYIVTYV